MILAPPNSLEYLRRLCADPLLFDHEAAVGTVLADPEDEPAPVAGEPDAARLAFADQLAAFGAPDGDGELPEGVA